MDMRTKLLIILLVAGMLLLALTVPAGAKTAAVSMQNMAFNPGTINISAGDTVTWTNNDAAPHDVDLGSMGKSPVLSKGGTYSKTFDQPGTYSYDCDIHPFMKGTVIVK